MFLEKKAHFWGNKTVDQHSSANSKKLFFAEICCKFLAFLGFLQQKRWKWLFRPAFGVRSTQTLVEIYNSLSCRVGFFWDFHLTEIPKSTKKNFNGSTYAVYLDQRFGVAHPKRWLKYIILVTDSTKLDNFDLWLLILNSLIINKSWVHVQ